MHSIWVCLIILALAPRAWAQSARAEEDAFSGANLQLDAPARADAAGPQRILAVQVEMDGVPADAQPSTTASLLGQTYSPALVRGALASLADTGRYAELNAKLDPVAGGVRVRIQLVSRKVVSAVEFVGGDLERDATLQVAGVAAGEEVTPKGLPKIADKVQHYYQAKGYPDAQVIAHLRETPEPQRVIVVVTINPGQVAVIRRRAFQVAGPNSAALRAWFDEYRVGQGDPADEEALNLADTEFEKFLKTHGWVVASVKHSVSRVADGAALRVQLKVGPHVNVHFEGNRTADTADLRRAVVGDDALTVDAITALLQEYYAERGYFDVRVRFNEVQSEDGSESDWLFTILEGERLRIVSRRYPCLVGDRSPAQVDDEVDAILGDQLPGGEEILTPPAPGATDRFWNPTAGGAHVTPTQSSPWSVYTPKAYQAALSHLRDLYRSEGYLSAVVGPVTLLRRACDAHSAPGSCAAVGQRVTPTSVCPNVEQPVPVEDAPQALLTCREEPLKGRFCEANAVVSIPVKLGPRTTLWDVEFQGNRGIVDSELLPIADLSLGVPVSQVALQQARRRILDRYQDEGYAFAQVEVELDLSQDHSRGRARFVIGERERVTVKGLVVRGAKNTNETLIRSRLELVEGGLYRRNWARSSEEQLALLGVFASVTVGLEDPDVPAREKTVVIQVEEQAAQYVEVRPGFSTGEGPRIEAGYTHRSLFGQAVLLRLRLQVGYLPDFLILEKAVRDNFQTLRFWNRLERRNSLTLEFPVAKRYRLSLDGIDVRDNSRDYGITKEAVIATLNYRPRRSVSLLVGAAAEHNSVRMWESDVELPYQLARLLAYPAGKSYALALRGGVAWDGTDNALGPTRGAGVSLDVEPVVAFVDAKDATFKLESCRADQDPSECEFRSRFIKLSNRIAGYIPFNDHGLTLALSLRWGVNLQLQSHSVTYTDRLFTLGGNDLRGHLQDSVIPQDIDEELRKNKNSADPEAISYEKIGLRAGDFMLNPKIELRIPLFSVFQTAIFLDTGNLWRSINSVKPYELRYTAGTGLRVVTPVGPLALDYGFKLDRRDYEPDLGALNFSLGWF